MNILQTIERPNVFLFANPSGLSVSLTRELLKNFCNVVIITNDVESVHKKTSELADKDFLKIVNLSTLHSINLAPNYIIFLSDLLEYSGIAESFDEAIIGKIAELSKKFNAATLLVFPSSIYPEVDLNLINSAIKLTQRNKELVGTLFLGDLIGPGINLSEARPFARVMKDIANNTLIRLSHEQTQIYPIPVAVASHQIIKRLFSFGGIGESVMLHAPALTTRNLQFHLTNINSNFRFVVDNSSPPFSLLDQYDKREIVEIDFTDSLRQAVDWFLPKTNYFVQAEHEIHPPAPAEVKTNFFPEVKLATFTPNIQDSSFSFTDEFLSIAKSKLPKLAKVKLPRLKFTRRKKLALLTILICLIFPYLSLFGGGISLVISKNSLMASRLQIARNANTFAKSTFRLSRGIFDIYSKVPFVGGMFESSEVLSNTVFKSTEVVDRGFVIVDTSQIIAEKVLGKGTGDLIAASKKLDLELDSLYRDLSFLEGELSNGEGVIGYFYNKFFGDAQIRNIREKISQVRPVIKELPDILGQEKKKTYLILFQNNMELRPTGGFIGTIALATFDRGKMQEIEVQDVYDADGQLKGHVEPPLPIKNYLGEANWYLRDSNWDPDFSLSAQRAEWFLDKEIDIQVDGVISIDLEYAKSLVNLFGEIQLKDFSKKITANNLYEVTQNEVEENFFPGSRKKSSFMTSLTRELLDRFTSINSAEYLGLAKVSLANLDSRHIQVFLHNANAQKAVATLNWDGAIKVPESCNNNCYHDFFGLVEANVGVNKVNYFVKRDASFAVSLENNLIRRTLTVNLQNTSNSDNYKNYIRVIAPSDVEFKNVDVTIAGTFQTLSPEVSDVRDKKEAGVLVDIPPLNNAKIVFKWDSAYFLDFRSKGNYDLLWRKQAGTLAHPGYINISTPVLTGSGITSYNTTLEKDFRTSTNW